MEPAYKHQAADIVRPLLRVPVRLIPPLGVAYGPADADTLRRDAQGFGMLAVEPGFHPSPPVENAAAYVSLSGFHKSNLSHRPYLERMAEAKGFLVGPDGRFVEDPHGPGTPMIDWRKPEVRAIMADYLKHLQQAGYNQFFFDAIDSLGVVESKNPAFAGLAMTATAFVVQMAGQMGPGALIVNGGLFTAQGIDPLPALGRARIPLALESQFTDGNGNRRPEADNRWTAARLGRYFSTAPGESAIYLIEHGVPAYRMAAERQAAQAWAQNWLAAQYPKHPIGVGLYMTENKDYRHLTPLERMAPPVPSRSGPER